MKPTCASQLATVLLALAPPGAALPLQAQTYPAKPVRMIVPFAPGGNTDIIARIVAPGMSKALGQNIIIDNRGGAGSMIGTEAASKSPPDGYTILMVSAAHVINPAMVKKLPFDPVRSFAAISKVADVPSALVVHPSLPVKNVKELVGLAKARPSQLHYASAGRGSVGHLSAELLGSLAQVKMTHVPYKGAGPALDRRSRLRCVEGGARRSRCGETPFGRRRRAGRQHAGGIRPVHAQGDRQVDQGRAHGRHRAGMTRLSRRHA